MDKYVRVVYQSEPIGKERIILYLTTFDKEAFERDNLFQLKEEKIIHEFERAELNRPDFIEMFERNLNTTVKNIYEEKLKEIESIMKMSKNVKNISNSDDVYCNIVYGNISNCDNIYCKEIKGNVSNCDKIIYK